MSEVNKKNVQLLAKYRMVIKILETNMKDLESDLLISLKTNPIPNVSIKVTDGQVRPKWKEEFVARLGENEAKKVQERTPRGKSSESIVIGNEFEPDVELISSIMESMDE